MSPRIPVGKLPPYAETYHDQDRLAIIDALNVLGPIGSCPSDHCQGCEYERHEAIRILYGALGLETDLGDQRRTHQEYLAIREKVWQVRRQQRKASDSPE